MKKSVSELNPNDVIKIGSDWFRVRYFHYRNLETSIDLQRECDQLSPICDSTCISISISKDLDIKFEVKGMNKYTELSDFKINKKVAENLKLNTIAYERTEIILFDDMDATPFDPCNNPADAMPIIIKNKIGMNFIDDNIGWSARDWNIELGELEACNIYYFRAAMICFLIMKDLENENNNDN